MLLCTLFLVVIGSVYTSQLNSTALEVINDGPQFCNTSQSAELYYYCCQDKYLYEADYNKSYDTEDPSCKSYWQNFYWDLEWFNSSSCTDYELAYKSFKSPLDLAAFALQGFSIFGLSLVAIISTSVIDPKKKVTAHPTLIIAQICLI